jgi:protein-S-isoprenylcysteine O-methyltransferase Ste14
MDSLMAFIFTYRGTLFPLAFIPPVVLASEQHTLLHYLIGFILVVLGLTLRILGVRRIGGRARVHSAGARHLMTSGIYGHVRNPLYEGNMLAAGGLTALYFSIWSVPLVLFLLVALYAIIARHEERCLELQMGDTYRKYLQEVPRWFFKLKPYEGSSASDPITPWSVVFKRERFFIFTCTALTFFSPLWHFHLSQLSFLEMPIPSKYRILIPTAAIVLISILLFLKIAARLQRKRGSWLKIDRVTDSKNLPV